MSGYSKEVTGRNKRLAYTLDNTLSHTSKEENSKGPGAVPRFRLLPKKEHIGHLETMQSNRQHPLRNQGEWPQN